MLYREEETKRELRQGGLRLVTVTRTKESWLSLALFCQKNSSDFAGGAGSGGLHY